VTQGPPKPAGPARALALGCGIVAALVLVVGGLAGAAFYKIRKGFHELSQVGASYLESLPQAQETFGEITRIEPKPGSFEIQFQNREGRARFGYAISGSKASGLAEVNLVKSGGSWRPVGARLTAGGSTVEVGAPSIPAPPGGPP
jgi:hypothetical protein